MGNEPFSYFASQKPASGPQPFKPLTIRPQQSHNPPSPEVPNAKRRRVSPPTATGFLSSLPVAPASLPLKYSSAPRDKLVSVPANLRQPLVVVRNPPAPTQPLAGGAEYYRVVWRAYTTKKNKTWDGDGILTVANGQASLQNEDGRSIGRMSLNGPVNREGVFPMAGKEVEIDSPISRAEFLQMRASMNQKTSSEPSKERVQKPRQTNIQTTLQLPKGDGAAIKTPRSRMDDLVARKGFRQPLKESTVLMADKDSSQPTPRHDPYGPESLVMKRPTDVPEGVRIVDVVVDPLLAKKLRVHQREGVSFLYECLMGMKSLQVRGAILAHEMGLGKTLTTIALIWTLLKQSPVWGDLPVVRKAMIVCPVTLIENWRKEFVKWLGRDRVGVFIAGEKTTRLKDFTKGHQYSVCIVGYERLRTIQKDLQKAQIDLVVADEGHRLKTAKNKSAEAIEGLNAEKRIILSGTPIQNNLGELFHMVNFVNPNILNKWAAFKRDFEVPIDKGREPNASLQEIQRGEEQSVELQNITDSFTHRRSADILEKFLPPKTEYVIFCPPTDIQRQIYKAVVQSFGGAPGSWDGALPMINILKKLCNSPTLLTETTNSIDDDLKAPPASTSAAIAAIPPHLHHVKAVSGSGKMRVLDRLLFVIHKTTQEKVVLVSNYTSTLDQFVTILARRGLPFLRLDGSTNPKKRQTLVDAFNSTPARQNFAFVLSAKAGGVGLNLIGASRLILFDCDWNPSTDLQAMARVHRDGQKKEVRIYRLLTKGCLDEKIFQRQCEKRGLADRVVDGKVGKSTFSKEELRDLFRIDESPGCRTHELLGCDCKGLGHSADNVGDGGEFEDIRDILDSSDDDDLPDMAQVLKASQIDVVKQEADHEKRKDRARSRSAGKKYGKSEEDRKQALQALMAYSHIDCSRKTNPVAEKALVKAEADDSEDDDPVIGRARTLHSGETEVSDDKDNEAAPSMEGLGGLIEDDVLLRIVQKMEGTVDYIFAKTSATKQKE